MKRAAVEAIARSPARRRRGRSPRLCGEARTFVPARSFQSVRSALILRIAPAVAKAAMASGVATRPIADLDAYAEQLNRFVFRSGFVMKPVFATAKSAPMRVVYAEGEDERILRASRWWWRNASQSRSWSAAGRDREAARTFRAVDRAGARLRADQSESDPRYDDFVQTYIEAAGRRHHPEAARTLARTNATVIAALALRRGDADP